MTAWRHTHRANRARTETLDNQLLVPSTSSSEKSDTCDVVFQASYSFCESPSDLPSALAGRHYESDENEFENESTTSDHEIPSDEESSMSLSSDDNAACNSDDSSNGHASLSRQVDWATPMGGEVLLLGPFGVVGIADTSSLHLPTHNPCLATTHNHMKDARAFILDLPG
ncbi:hypothetical protein ACROYT_G016061 [Oculina patagonica]